MVVCMYLCAGGKGGGGGGGGRRVQRAATNTRESEVYTDERLLSHRHPLSRAERNAAHRRHNEDDDRPHPVHHEHRLVRFRAHGAKCLGRESESMLGGQRAACRCSGHHVPFTPGQSRGACRVSVQATQCCRSAVVMASRRETHHHEPPLSPGQERQARLQPGTMSAFNIAEAAARKGLDGTASHGWAYKRCWRS